MTNAHIIAEIEALAPFVRDLRAKPDAEPQYCILSDAVVWIDEAPFYDVKPSKWWYIRLVWDCRTKLVLGREIDQPEVWAAAHRCFPEWIGFMPERCEPTDELRALYTRVMRDGHEHWPCLRADNPSR
ncbi:MAG: hypothetical protein KIT19_09930 [Phycisphaeraceae bacterium]|nr:hypothetical protein [Phycisphaeraceae bacterium]